MNTIIEASADLQTLYVWHKGDTYLVHSHKTGQPYPITDVHGLPVDDLEVFKAVKREARFYLHNVLLTTYLDYTQGL